MNIYRRLRTFRLFTLTAALAVLTGAAQAQPSQPVGFSLSVLPSAPTSIDSVIGRITIPVTCTLDPDSVQVIQDPVAAGAMRVMILPQQSSCIPIGGPVNFDIQLGQFPAGTYTVKVVYSATEVAGAQFEVSQKAAAPGTHRPLVNYSDLWATPQESGWGLSIHQHSSDLVFAAWYVYDVNRQPTWYSLQPGQWLSFNTYAGPVYRTTGPYWSGPFDQATVTIAQVGTATLTFDSFIAGTFSYTIDGITGTKQITRLPY